MSSYSADPAWALDGPTFDANTVRVNDVAATFFNNAAGQVAGGVLPSGGQLLVTAGSGMQVAVAAGYAVIASGSGSTYGGYTFGTPAGTLTIATSDPSNPRIDLVIAFVNDLGTSSSVTGIEVVTGTPAPSPTAPVPSGVTGYIALAQVLVPAGSTSVSSGNITDERPFTAAQGGVISVWAPTYVPPGYAGLYLHDRSSGRLVHDPAGTAEQPHVLPFAPQLARSTTGFSAVTGTVLALSTTVTTDGMTDLEIIARWRQVQVSGGSATWGQYGVTMEFAIDGTVVAEMAVGAFLPIDMGGGGGTFHHVTASGADRPSAGTHTIAWNLVPVSDGTHAVQVLAGATYPAILYVKPVCL